MTTPQIRFEDGAAYERSMGVWSRVAGETFLEWLAPPENLRWVDVGCGNGAFTHLLFDLCNPSSVEGVDPSEGQLAYARTRLAGQTASFQAGSALQLPFPDRDFDAAVMALVIFFVPDPAKGVAEMARVTRSGGLVAAYAWDILAGGFTQEPVWAEMRAMGLTPPLPPRSDTSRIDALRALWLDASLEQVETRTIPVSRTFETFEDYWLTTMASATGKVLATLPADDVEGLKERARRRLPAASNGAVTWTARANAVKGRVRRSA